MKQLILVIGVCCHLTTAIAQDTATVKPSYWNNELQTGLNMNQSTFSENWRAGGVNSIALGLFLNAKANYEKDNNRWTNDLQLQYGNVQNKGQNMRKNADRIFFDTKYSRKFHPHWSFFASVNFMSQFDAGFEYYKLKDSVGKEYGEELSTRISGFLSPAYLTEALGFEYKPVSYFSAQFGVGALRQTFVTDQTLYDKYLPTDEKYNLLYGVKRGENMRNQTVFQFVANFDKEIMTNVVLKARYLALLDYQNINGQGTVHRLDANLTAKVNKYINVNLTGVLLFDNDQDKDIQFSQVLALGILYTINNQKP
jgi:hypothetical protein